MTITELKDQKIAILGFGQEGQAVFSYLKKHNLKATIFDEDAQSQFPTEAEVFSGPEAFKNLSGYTVLFRSPGIWRNLPEILKVETEGAVITSQVKWFFDNSPAKIIGVTGTKGKGTTCSLIQNGLVAAGKKSYLTGNIGKLQPLEFLDDLKPDDWVVYELSSFQLQDLMKSPHIGVCLMVTSDHLNHHADLKEYHSAKAAISAFQTQDDTIIFNADYEPSKLIGEIGEGQKLKISTKSKPKFGAYIEKENVIIALANGAVHEIDCTNRKLRGRHNLENIAAACLALLSAGVEIELISQVTNTFAGLEHRLQFVANKNGVSFYNDSISTVPDTTIAAVNSFSEPIHLFLGGSDKGLEYQELIRELKSKPNIASITLVGQTGKQIKEAIENSNWNVETRGVYNDFTKAFKDTVAAAKPGDVVLLSPAAASFDMFKNYGQRGQEFIKLVENL